MSAAGPPQGAKAPSGGSAPHEVGSVGAPLLHLRVRGKSFGDKRVLGSLQLRLPVGRVTSLVGASGCGKSTLLRIVAGLETDFDGEVWLDGQRQHGRNADIGYIFQEPRLFPWLTVADNVQFGADPRRPQPERVAQLLDEVGLAPSLANALPKQLSGGQAQRAAIARGLYHQPRLLLLDEPFSAVDAFTRMKLQDLLARLARDHGITVLLVTHDIEEAVYLGDEVVVMETDPGVIRTTVAVNAARPRDRTAPALSDARADVLAALHAVHAL